MGDQYAPHMTDDKLRAERDKLVDDRLYYLADIKKHEWKKDDIHAWDEKRVDMDERMLCLIDARLAEINKELETRESN